MQDFDVRCKGDLAELAADSTVVSALMPAASGEEVPNSGVGSGVQGCGLRVGFLPGREGISENNCVSVNQ